MFRLLFFIFAVPLGIYAWFLTGRILLFFGVDLSKGHNKGIRLLLSVLAAVTCVGLRNTSAMVMLHFLAVSIGCDVLNALAVKMGIGNKNAFFRTMSAMYRSGMMALILTGIFLGYGYANMKHVVRTEYRVSTKKEISTYRIGLISDLHYGTVQDPSILREKVKEMNGQNLDLVILDGDITDEGTTKERMEECFEILGDINTGYGIYYVYGNHDIQPYSRSKWYTEEELKYAIEKNDIMILADSCVEINHELILAGRKDAGWNNSSGRLSSEKLLEGISRENYMIVADHQPTGMQENSVQGVDLQLSGHTHNGQIWPVGLVTRLMGDLTYGEYHAGDCTVIVSSGFTGWGYPIRTQGHCEYVIIELCGI